MTDRELQQLLPDYVTGRLNPKLRRLIEQRCAASDELRLSLEAARQYNDALNAVDEIRAPGDFLDKVHRRIEQPKGLLTPLFSPARRRLPVEFAGVIVTALLLIVLFNPFSGRLQRLRTSRPVQEYEARQSLPPPQMTQQAPEHKEEVLSYSKEEPAPLATTPRLRAEVQPPAKAKNAEEKRPLVRKNGPPITAIATKQPNGETEEKRELPRENLLAKKNVRPAPPSPAADEISGYATAATGESGHQLNAFGGAPPPVQSVAPSSPAASGLGMADRSSEPEFLSEASESIEYPEKRVPRTKAVRSFSMEKSAATEAPSVATVDNREPEGTSLLSSVEKVTLRYRGTIDSVLIDTGITVTVRLTLPVSRLALFQKRLSRTYSVSVIETLPTTDTTVVSAIVEIHRE